MKPRDDLRERFLKSIEAHQGLLHRICALYASRPEDRRDLFQETLLQLWRSYPSFGERSRFSTWAYRVALNTALTQRRTRRARPEASDDLSGVAAPPVEPPDEDVQALEQALRELGEVDRALILLRLEGHGYEEIAEITGIGRGAVSVRLVRIKERLRRKLGARLSDERSMR
jgi:RNA polymerase sigma-70 factor (ECF subfamily)